MHRAISFEQCICNFVLLGNRFMIKPNNQAKSPDATFQSRARKAEMVVLEVNVLQLGWHGLAWVSKQVHGTSDSMPCERVSEAGGLQVLTACKADSMQK